MSWREKISTNPPLYYMLETYEETTIFIPVDFTEDAVELVSQKVLEGYGPGGRY